MLTYGKAKQILSKFVGRGGSCPGADQVDLFTKQVLQYLLFKGSNGFLRKFCFISNNGCVTIPYELETPLKVRFDSCKGLVHDKWFEWTMESTLGGACSTAANTLSEEASYYPTIYDLPSCGSRVGALPICQEDAGSIMIVQGYDGSGREIYTSHKGEQISGEVITLDTKGQIKYTQSTFAKIKNIIKPKTRGYIQLYAIIPGANEQRMFLADYSPLEEIPAYRRYRIIASGCGGPTKVQILGRIRLKENYADEDVIPFDNYYALSLAGQAMNATFNDDIQTADFKTKLMQDAIDSENEMKRPNIGAPVEIARVTSAGSVMNIIGSVNGWFGGNWRR